MKTLFFAVVALSFTSGCWSAPLTCNNLVKEVDKDLKLGGRWYLIAVSSDSCVITSVMKFLGLSLKAEFTPGAEPNVYDMFVIGKTFGYCGNGSQPLTQNNNNLMWYDENSKQTVVDTQLQTSCPDCFIGKEASSTASLYLFSRRQNVNDDELDEFVKQSECVKHYPPVVLNTDHDYDNCMNGEFDPNLEELFNQRMADLLHALFNCLNNYMRSWYQSVTTLWS